MADRTAVQPRAVPRQSAAPRRLRARAAATLIASFLLGPVPALVRAADEGPRPATADIELRKSFRNVRSPGRQPSRDAAPDERREAPAAPPGRDPAVLKGLGAVADALGDRLQTSGALHLPLSAAGGLVVPGDINPVLETAAGRRVIVDRTGALTAAAAAEVAERWPGFSVVRAPPGAPLRDVIGSVLDAAGYESVLRGTPVVLGRATTVRFLPDFVVLRDEDALLQGDLLAVSVVEAAEAFPPELRQLAAEQRVRLLELDPGGAPAGEDASLWRDPSGRVTTMETARLGPLLREIAATIGVAAEQLSAAQAAATGLEREAGGPAGAAPAAVGALLAGSGVPAIGPTVELYRPGPAGGRGRFVISVPGWLAEVGGRRLLITGAAPPPQVRLFLTREGIDLFEYRLRQASAPTTDQQDAAKDPDARRASPEARAGSTGE